MRYTSTTVLWLALAAASAGAACQSDQQAETAAAAADAPAAGSAVHAEQPSEAPHATAEETMEIGYTCADEKTFEIAFAGQDELLITIDGESHKLARSAGHAGMLFSNDDIVFYGQGREASVEIGGEPTFMDCEAAGHPQ